MMSSKRKAEVVTNKRKLKEMKNAIRLKEVRNRAKVRGLIQVMTQFMFWILVIRILDSSHDSIHILN